MGGGPPRPPVLQGTSRVVPVVVSAGLAVGVFCGLLFGLGTGKRTASAEPSKATNGVKRTEATPEPQPTVKPPDKVIPKPGSNTGSAVAANTGSAGSNPAMGSGSAGSNAASAPPALKPTKLIVEIKPDSAAQGAKILVDGKEITGTTTDIAADPGVAKKKVKVLVKAPSYKDVEQEVELEGESTTLKLELTKAGRATGSTAGTEATGGTSAGTTSHPSGTSGTGGKATGGKGKGKGKGSGGLIDI